jgi:Spy/CpxP family protein refolding chaperone
MVNNQGRFMKFNQAAFCGLLCAALIIPAYGQEKRPEHFKKMFEQLNLSDKQKQAMEANKAAHRGKLKHNFEKMKALKEEFNTELMKPKLNMGKINTLQNQFKTFQAQLVDDRLNSILAVRKILTPEQFAKFISLVKEHEMRYHFKEGEKPGEPIPPGK